MEPSNENGLAIEQEHYKKSALQPIEIMQLIMSPEEFKGFLLGNVIKYRMRCKFKGQEESDKNKAKQYSWWLCLAKEGEIIDPKTDTPPPLWKEPTIKKLMQI